MSETESLPTLCRTFLARYETWQGCREAGIETLFVRMHLRGLRTVIESIESIVQPQDERPPELLKIQAQMDEVKQALHEMDRKVSENGKRHSIYECLNGLAEFRLLEIDRLLETPFDPAQLVDFEFDTDDETTK